MIVLTMVQEGIDHTGLLHINPIRRETITAILEDQKGRSIEEIGQLYLYNRTLDPSLLKDGVLQTDLSIRSTYGKMQSRKAKEVGK